MTEMNEHPLEVVDSLPIPTADSPQESGIDVYAANVIAGVTNAVEQTTEEHKERERRIRLLRDLVEGSEAPINNERALANANEIIKMSRDELLTLNPSDRRSLLRVIRWHGAESSTWEEAPESTHDAEAMIYETYAPSETLSRKHNESLERAIGRYTPEQLWKMAAQWETMGRDEKVERIGAWTHSICQEYGMPDLKIIVGELKTETDRGMELGFFPASSYQKGEVGAVMIPERQLATPLPLLLERVRHEVAHGYQYAGMKELVPKADRAELAEDLAWFALAEDQDIARNKNRYTAVGARYEILPMEQDAFIAQRGGRAAIDRMLNSHRDAILSDAGLSAYEKLDKQAAVARWVKAQISAGTSASREEIIQLAQTKLPSRGVERVSELLAQNETDDVDVVATGAITLLERANMVLREAGEVARRKPNAS